MMFGHQRLAKALIRMRVCAGWSEPLLVAHTTLLEISCHGSNFIDYQYNNNIQINKSYQCIRVIILPKQWTKQVVFRLRGCTCLCSHMLKRAIPINMLKMISKFHILHMTPVQWTAIQTIFSLPEPKAQGELLWSVVCLSAVRPSVRKLL